MSAAESQQQARKLPMKMRSESISAIEERGWSPRAPARNLQRRMDLALTPRNPPMRALSTAFSALAAAACFAHAALAQPPDAPPSQQPPPAQAPDIEVTDSDLDTFATIYVDLQSALQEFEARAAEVTTEEEAQQLQAEMQQEGISTIEQHGWSPEQFNRVAQAINADPELVERVTAMIEERS